MLSAPVGFRGQFEALPSSHRPTARPLGPEPRAGWRPASWLAAAGVPRARSSVRKSFAGSTQESLARSPQVRRYLVTPEPRRWRKPFKPAIRPERDPTYYSDDDPRKSRPQFAKFALMAKELCWVTSYQLEEARREIVAASSRSAKVYLRVYPHNAITQRIADSRMGASKGKFEYWVAALKPGVVIFEINVDSEELARMALKAGSRKLPFKVGFKMREEGPSLFEITG
ncbi:50S ribosomal protein L16 [Durusdinium trenchii]|uniref:Chloroplastic n=1 Tax=Durusdinium trenchii TaxID=1381693 RepID=A0ABP0L6Z6_9DINO